MNKIWKKVEFWLLRIYYISITIWFINTVIKQIYFDYHYTNDDIVRILILLLVYITDKLKIK